MKIKKCGHCCLVFTINGTTVMTDPGAWSELQNKEQGIDLIFITHEHQDHFHVDSLKTVFLNNPKAMIVTNTAVARLLSEIDIPCSILENGQTEIFKGVSVTGVGDRHAPIYPIIPDVQNTGYIFDDKFYYPGDAFTLPEKPIEILALPVCGPWMHIRESIDFAKACKPRIVFPVHDAMLGITGPFHRLPMMALEKEGITFIPLLASDILDTETLTKPDFS